MSIHRILISMVTIMSFKNKLLKIMDKYAHRTFNV